MKPLKIQAMQALEAGNPLWCIAGGIIFGSLFTPAAGIAFDIACEVLTPTKAY